MSPVKTLYSYSFASSPNLESRLAASPKRLEAGLQTSELIAPAPAFVEAHFLGISVHAMTVDEMHAAIGYAIQTSQKWLIANHNLHSLYLIHREIKEDVTTRFRDYFSSARWTQVDGMSLVGLARLAGFSIGRNHRIAYNLSIRSTMRMAEERGWRVFYLGSTERVAKAGADKLLAEFPYLKFANAHGYFDKQKDSPQNQAVLAKIAAFCPNVLYVGMGMPIQEQWIAENYEVISANVIFASGATLDYIADALPTPPYWVSQSGIEWAYRLIREPRRLGFRYLVEPWLILLYIVQQRFMLIFPRFRSLGSKPR